MQSEKPEEPRPDGAQISPQAARPEAETELPETTGPDGRAEPGIRPIHLSSVYQDGQSAGDGSAGAPAVTGPLGLPPFAERAPDDGDRPAPDNPPVYHDNPPVYHGSPPVDPGPAESLFQRPQNAIPADEPAPRVEPFRAPALELPTPAPQPQRKAQQSSTGPRKVEVETPARAAAPKHPAGLLDMAESEELISEVDSGDDGRFVLTTLRLIYQGRTAEGAIFSATGVRDVTAIEFGRRPRDARSAWWGVVGLIAAIAVWQVTSNETVGAIAGAVVAGISLLLLADYWFRPAGLILRFGTPGGSVEGPVSGKRVRDAEALAVHVQQLKHAAQTGAGKTGRPPGGSPGLS